MLNLVLSFLAALPLHAQSTCPPWLLKLPADVPKCAVTDLVPENFPVGTLVLSDADIKLNPNFIPDLVERILKASGARPPRIVLPVSDPTMKDIESRIERSAQPAKLRRRWRDAIVQIPGTRWAWERDLFYSTLNLTSGRPALHALKSYDPRITARPYSFQDHYDGVLAAAGPCGLERGVDLNLPMEDGFVQGGNMMGLPGNICAIGDTHAKEELWDQIARSVCPSEQSLRLKIPTAWLKSVGHVDEILKVLPRKYQPAPCNFTIAVASPDKAFELMAQRPNEAFFDFSASAIQAQTRIRGLGNGLMRLCQSFGGRTAQAEQNHFLTVALNGFLSLFKAKGRAPASDNYDDCAKITNAQAARIFQGEMQDVMTEPGRIVREVKAQIVGALRSRLPQCKIDTLDLPILFDTSGGLALTPNLVNAITIDQTNIMPDPYNKAFRDYTTGQLRQRGLTADYVDAYPYAEAGGGNVHCLTQTHHVCRP